MSIELLTGGTCLCGRADVLSSPGNVEVLVMGFSTCRLSTAAEPLARLAMDLALVCSSLGEACYAWQVPGLTWLAQQSASEWPQLTFGGWLSEQPGWELWPLAIVFVLQPANGDFQMPWRFVFPTVEEQGIGLG